MLTIVITSIHGCIILQLLTKTELPTILVSSLPWILISASFLLIRKMKLRSPFICMWIVDFAMSMIRMKILLPIGLNGILTLLLVPIMVIKSILSGKTIRGDIRMK